MTLYLTSPQFVGLGEIGLFDIECSPQHSSPFVTDNESRTNQLPINRFTDDTVFTSLSSFALSAMADYGSSACKPIRCRQEMKLSYRLIWRHSTTYSIGWLDGKSQVQRTSGK